MTKDSDKKSNVMLTLEGLTPADAQRLVEAVRAGKLAEFGVSDAINIIGPDKPKERKWSDGKRPSPPSDPEPHDR